MKSSRNSKLTFVKLGSNIRHKWWTYPVFKLCGNVFSNHDQVRSQTVQKRWRSKRMKNAILKLQGGPHIVSVIVTIQPILLVLWGDPTRRVRLRGRYRKLCSFMQRWLFASNQDSFGHKIIVFYCIIAGLLDTACSTIQGHGCRLSPCTAAHSPPQTTFEGYLVIYSEGPRNVQHLADRKTSHLCSRL